MHTCYVHAFIKNTPNAFIKITRIILYTCMFMQTCSIPACIQSCMNTKYVCTFSCNMILYACLFPYKYRMLRIAIYTLTDFTMFTRLREKTNAVVVVDRVIGHTAAAVLTRVTFAPYNRDSVPVKTNSQMLIYI